VVIWNTPALPFAFSPALGASLCAPDKGTLPGGGDVRTSLDLGVQHTVEQLLSNHLRRGSSAASGTAPCLSWRRDA